MKNYPIEKYHFYTNHKDKVIAVSTYEGRPVRGVAKCDPRDGFNLEKGKQLAVARCAEKIARKRARRADREYRYAIDAQERATRRLDKMNDYKSDAKQAVIEASQNVKKILETM